MFILISSVYIYFKMNRSTSEFAFRSFLFEHMFLMFKVVFTSWRNTRWKRINDLKANSLLALMKNIRIHTALEGITPYLMQTTSFRIWTRVIQSISYNDSYYATSTLWSKKVLYTKKQNKNKKTKQKQKNKYNYSKCLRSVLVV